MSVRVENCISKGKSDLALLVEVDGVDYWIPFSQIHDDSEVWKVDQEGDLVITDWLGEKMGGRNEQL